jgi:GH24 family phage-related lysozyme (muramidase)
MDSVMPSAPENIERASGIDEPTSPNLKETSKSKTESIMLLGIIIGKALGAIIKKLKDLLDPLFKLFAKGLAAVYRGLAKVTFGVVSEAYTSTAEGLEAYGESPAASGEEPTATTPGAPGVSAAPAPVATGYTPAVTTTSPTTPTSPKSAYAAPSGFFGAPTLGTAKTTDSAMPIVAGDSLSGITSSKMTTNTKSTNNISSLIKKEEGFKAKAYFDPPKNKQDDQNAERKKEGKPPLPYKYSIGYGHQIRQDEIAQGFINLGDEKIPVKGEGGKDTIIPGTKEEAKIRAGKLLDIDLPKYTARAKDPLGEEAWNKLTENQQAALVSYSYNVGSTTNLAKKHGLKEAIMKGDTTAAANIIAEKGIKTSSGKLDPVLVARRKKEAALFKQDSIKGGSLATMSMKPQSSAGSLSVPTQATGRNIEMTSQILNSAPSVTTAQNTQPVVINNINAPTVAAGKGSSGPAIEMSLFRNIDNSIQANTNRHLRAGILGV